ncbi:MAG: hypothetical protein ABUS49_05020 [Acidobacteriota bacterium]
MKVLLLYLLFCGYTCAQSSLGLLNRNRPLLDAHNCYPYEGKWNDRIDRALGTGYPVGIEQDVAWGIDKATGKGRPVVSHTPKTTGSEPALREYFFEHVRPLVEAALRANDRAAWPLITVHFDFKDNRLELLHAVWDLLGEYQDWITTATKAPDPHALMPFDVRPLLVLTEENDAQEEVFFNALPMGSKLRLFGSAHTVMPPAASREQRARVAVTTPPEVLLAESPTNYRRWWNNSWAEVEEGGQAKAGEWTQADEARLRALVDHAHKRGFWIRFYTLDGFRGADEKGWGQGYNFGSPEAAVIRWKAAYAAGVNLIATDQYEDLAATLKTIQNK